MAHIPLKNGHKFRAILALSCKLRLVSFQAKLIFQDGSECGKKVGILYMKFCSDVHTMMRTSHIKIKQLNIGRVIKMKFWISIWNQHFFYVKSYSKNFSQNRLFSKIASSFAILPFKITKENT